MTQVSKYPLRKDVEQRMLEVFRSAISQLKSSEEIEDFLEDFLSPVEKIMLAKRLPIAVLLGKGYAYETIRGILRVTPPTIASVSIRLKYAGKGYKRIVEKIAQDGRSREFWDKIGDIIINIPHSKGASLQRQKKEYYKKKFQNRKAF